MTTQRASGAALRRRISENEERDRLKFIEQIRELVQTAETQAVRELDGADRHHVLVGVACVRQVLEVLDLLTRTSTATPKRWMLIRLRNAAIGVANAANAKALGVAPFGLLFGAAFDAGLSMARLSEDMTRSDNAKPKHSASQQLRALAVEYPHESAAELRRRLESAAGGRMDESAARKVVRDVRRRLK